MVDYFNGRLCLYFFMNTITTWRGKPDLRTTARQVLAEGGEQTEVNLEPRIKVVNLHGKYSYIYHRRDCPKDCTNCIM